MRICLPSKNSKKPNGPSLMKQVVLCPGIQFQPQMTTGATHRQGSVILPMDPLIWFSNDFLKNHWIMIWFDFLKNQHDFIWFDFISIFICLTALFFLPLRKTILNKTRQLHALLLERFWFLDKSSDFYMTCSLASIVTTVKDYLSDYLFSLSLSLSLSLCFCPRRNKFQRGL